jgi:phosphopantothenoylcysteine decarboxylase/phosphopantothenate--cysteine ligase
MGTAVAAAAIEAGHEVTVVSGPVEVAYPPAANVLHVTTTAEMLAAAEEQFPRHDGLVGVAAPCDYQPRQVAADKIRKTGDVLMLELIETPDVIATVAATKRPDQWVVGFALETSDEHFRAVSKMEQKNCDMMVLNGPAAIGKTSSYVEIFAASAGCIGKVEGSKDHIARTVLQAVADRLL